MACAPLAMALPALMAQEIQVSGDAWDALIAETESASEWADDPFAGLDILDAASDDLLFIASVAAGPGHSSNYLKRSIAQSSSFAQLELSAYLNWFGEDTSVTAFAFAEASLYQRDNGVRDEYMAIAQGSWVRSRKSLDYGAETVVFLADQIYDASLNSLSAPVGSRIRQFMPKAALFLDWFPASRDRLRLEPSVLRADYDLEGEDYWEPGLGMEWERLWIPGLTTRSRLEYTRQSYDSEFARLTNGTTRQPPQRLEIDTWTIEGTLDWRPVSWQWLQLRASAGATWEDDLAGDYEKLRRIWSSAGPQFSFSWGNLLLSGRWSELRFDARPGSSGQPLLQNQRSLKAELKKNLPWDLAAYLKAEWIRFDSRNRDESYRERRIVALLEWNY